jgi:hypothetical protein
MPDTAGQCCGSGSGAFLTDESRSGKKSESGMKISYHIFKSLAILLSDKYSKFFVADPDPGSLWPWIWDVKIRIWDKNPGSVTNAP